MITMADILNFNVYKKEAHTGSDRGMRYRLGCEEIVEKIQTESGEEQEEKKKVLAVYIWPEPFAFDQTKDEQKERKEFPFSREGQKQALEWLNKTREERSAYWQECLENFWI